MVPAHEDPAVHALLAGGPAFQVAWLRDRALPPAVLLPLLNACAQRCFFCAGPGTVSVPEREVTSWSTIDAQLRPPPGVSRLLVGGNEPALHPSFADALQLSRERGFSHVDLMTNGTTLVTGARAWSRLGLREVVVPLYGTRAAEHDAVAGLPCFEAVIAGLRAAHAVGIRVWVHTLAMRETLPRLGELAAFTEAEFGTRLGLGLLRPKPVFDWSRHAVSLGQLRRALVDLDVDLLAAPLCLAWGQGDDLVPGPSRPASERSPLATIYFLTQRRCYLPACEGCPSRANCGGVVGAYSGEKTNG
ncbi:MAG: radical SAM protein [Deltaproteobacteria bacterium]|nr:radical SAM protein [Deltaproteobacteria bacterium]